MIKDILIVVLVSQVIQITFGLVYLFLLEKTFKQGYKDSFVITLFLSVSIPLIKYFYNYIFSYN